MQVWMRRLGIALVALALAAPLAHAQSQTGSITGVVTDTSGAVLPGVTVSVSGETLIGGVQTQVTGVKGGYRFDRLPPGSYDVKFELQGFKTVQQTGIQISALFVATVNIKLSVGSVSETLTVTGEAPTIDTKSNVQQTVMNQALLEGIPTGRDPWSVAKIVPGMQVSTYDVGGTQGMQQSSLSVHGSNTNDVNYNIDGASINWPGGGGGATMAYFDQGMFSEVNYTTSAIPAEQLVGGVAINMVTKEAGNKWRGSARYYYANDSMQGDNTGGANLTKWGFLGSPITRLYDFNFGGGGAIVKDKLWVNGEVRDWSVNTLTNAKNADGSRAVDDNTIRNYFVKGVWQAAANHKFSFSYTYDNKVRAHRRNTPPDFVPDIAALHQNNPASIYQGKYTGIFNKAVYESAFSVMSGQTSYLYQDGTNGAIRVVDNTLSTANYAAQYHEENPNSKLTWNNVVSYTTTKGLGDHLFKAGVQYTRLRYEQTYTVNGDMYPRVQQRRADAGAGVEHARLQPQPGALARHLRPGLLDDRQQADAELRAALRHQQGDDPGAVEPGRHVRRRAVGRRVEPGRPEARRVALRHVVRSGRRRPDGDQGELQPLRHADRRRPRDQRQPVRVHEPDLPLDRPQRGRHGPGERDRRLLGLLDQVGQLRPVQRPEVAVLR